MAGTVGRLTTRPRAVDDGGFFVRGAAGRRTRTIDDPPRPSPAPAPLSLGEGANEVLVIVPAYNEERSLPMVLDELREHCAWTDVIVVNDGSSDATAEVAARGGAEVLTLAFNLGIGGAVQTGFLYAASRGYAAVVQVDADGQHPAAFVRRLVEPVLSGACDVTLGSRFLGQSSYRQTFWRARGIGILSRLISVLVHQPITDPTSGFRAYNREAAAYLAQEYPYDYPEPEALVALSHRHFRIKEISVDMRPRYDGVSSIGTWIGGKYMFKVTLAVGLSMLRSDKSRPRSDAVAAPTGEQ